ncbi:MAG: hypothetical protein J6U20_04810 [Fibrobacter sp.]|nr:hypothetical protein [Fibrobacter sp.]
MSFWNRKKEKVQGKYKEIPFQHLAPIDTVDDKTTFDALDYALSQKNIHNIALTGNYGAGKSSILESYIKRNKRKNDFLKISLATFAVENKDENANQENVTTISEANQKAKEDDCTEARETKNSKGEFPETILQKIEKSILQQILYRKSGIKLPNSRFIRIKRTNKIDVIITEIVVLALFFVSNYFIHGKIWEYICKPMSIPLKWDSIALSISLLFALFLFLYKVILFAKRLRIAKLCFNNAEIEFKGCENEESLLNKYLDELLYFFEVTKYKVVVFEDLDRFNNTEIFIKLRELNTLLNNYEKINRKILFVYALRDEVFRDSSRTKFFDFIIPVIPVINNQNSSDVLYNYWMQNRASAFGKIDENFLQDIGLYVDDMRLLINSINEFKIYDQRINEEDYEIASENTDKKVCYDRNKIFALVLYKNLYPSDFALLAQNEGDLYSILQKRKDVAKNGSEQIEREIQILENEIQEIEHQIDLDKKELRIIYISKIFSKKPDNCYIALNADDFTSDEEFDKIKKNASLECLQYARRNDYYGTWSYEKSLFSYNFSNIEKEIDSKYSYDKREEMIKSKADGKLNVLKRHLKEKKSDISEISNKSVKELLETIAPESFTGHLKKQNKKFNDFIIYLLRHGYIDENYSEYISNFYAKSLSVHEKQYLRLIKDQQPPSFELILSNVNNVINRIKDIEWKLPAVLNNSMLSYLLITDDCHLKDFLGALWNFKLTSHDDFFLSKFNASPTCLSKLYQGLYEFLGHENSWINVIFDNEHVGTLYYFFVYVDFEKTEENILSYLTKDLSFLHREDIDKNTVSSKINYYSLKFNLLEDTAKYPVYDILLDNAAYIISKKNIDIIIKHANGDVTEESIKDYYTQISKLKKKNIKAYVDQNIDVFVNDIVLSTGDSMAESKEAFIELLNDENLATETKAKLIEKNNCVVSDITRIKGAEIQLADGDNKSIDIRNLLYKHKKVSPSWVNIYEIFKYNGNKLDQCLVDYLNDEQIVNKLIESKPLADEEVEENKGNHEVASTFYNNVLVAENLSLSSFATIMEVYPWCYEAKQNNIDSDKLDIIIELGKISLSFDNYSKIGNNYSSLLPKYIKKHFDDFINKWSELKIVIDINDLKLLLDCSELDKDQKTRLFKLPLEIWGSTISKEDYIWLGKKIIELNISQEIQAPVLQILRSIDDENDLIIIICLQGKYHYLRNNDIINIVNSKMGEPYQSCVKREGKHEKIPYSKLNQQFCAVLSAKGIISRYQIEGDKIRVIQRRP